MRSTPTDLPTDARQLLSRLATDPYTALPVTEQAVFVHNQTAGAVNAVATYLPSPGGELDYPYIVMTPDPSTAAAATALLGRITGVTGRQKPADEGFLMAGKHSGAALGLGVVVTGHGLLDDPGQAAHSASSAQLVTGRRS